MANKDSGLNTARIFRIAFAAVWIILLTLPFVFFARSAEPLNRLVLKTQFGPAIMGLASGSVLAFALLLLLTLILGRVYCSFLCPLGIWQDVVGRIARIFKSKKQKLTHYGKPLNWVRYIILGLVFVLFLFGITYPFAFLDPYSIYGRFASMLFGNAAKGMNNLLSNIFPASFGLQRFANFQTWAFAVALFMFCAVTVVSSFLGRIWCNSICPVGSLMSLVSPYSMFRMHIDPEQCKHCKQCELHCKSHCIDSSKDRIDLSRCVVCFNCSASCKFGAMSYKFSWGGSANAKRGAEPKPAAEATGEPADKSRREMIGSLAAAALAVGAVSLSGKLGEKKDDPLGGMVDDGPKKGTAIPKGIVPPGGLSRIHLKESCTACQACVSACPKGIIHPAVTEYGLDGLMMPVISYEHGYCDYDCHACSDVCPAGALVHIPLEEKRKTQIGEVYFIAKNCLVPKLDANCGQCAKHCPTGAITLVRLTTGKMFPRITEETRGLCIGCGKCEYYCPADPKGMRVIPKAIHTMVTATAPLPEVESTSSGADSLNVRK
jgi:polyferredoxin